MNEQLKSKILNLMLDNGASDLVTPPVQDLILALVITCQNVIDKNTLHLSKAQREIIDAKVKSTLFYMNQMTSEVRKEIEDNLREIRNKGHSNLS